MLPVPFWPRSVAPLPSNRPPPHRGVLGQKAPGAPRAPLEGAKVRQSRPEGCREHRRATPRPLVPSEVWKGHGQQKQDIRLRDKSKTAKIIRIALLINWTNEFNRFTNLKKHKLKQLNDRRPRLGTASIGPPSQPQACALGGPVWPGADTGEGLPCGEMPMWGAGAAAGPPAPHRALWGPRRRLCRTSTRETLLNKDR